MLNFLTLDPAVWISKLIILLICFPVHELAHAYTADSLGDDTPRMMGRLSLNPLAHLDPMGTLLLLISFFGWAKPVPINPYALQRRTPAGVMWVSLAGPMSNLVMALLAAIPFRLGLLDRNMIFGPAITFSNITNMQVLLPQVLFEFIWINLILMLFNLIPIPPLDGDKIFDYFLPPSFSRVMDSIRPYGMLILLALAITPVLGLIIQPPLNFLMRLLIF